MILADTSVWVDHLRDGDEGLALALLDQKILGHTWVRAELALGHLRERRAVLGLLAQLPAATESTVDEAVALIERYDLNGAGIGLVDLQLLAATRLTVGAVLWTRDKRLARAADQCEVSFISR